MTAKEFAEKMDVTYTTIIRWLRLGLVPGAYAEEVLPGMQIWRIPHEAIHMQRPRAGAPRGYKRKPKLKVKKK